MVKGPCVAVLAVIDVKEGLVHYITRKKSIKKADFIQFLTELKSKCPERLTLFLDNCSVHRAHDSQDKMRELDILPHWNLPYRPDLNCIEIYWSQAKIKYRSKLLFEALNQENKTID